MSIPETLLKIKPWGIVTLKIASGILLIGLVFTLGRISVLSTQKSTEPIQIVYPPLIKTSLEKYSESGTVTEPENWAFAGSKTGKTFYPKGCPLLARVKPENRVYFTTASEASIAGYHSSTGCDSL